MYKFSNLENLEDRLLAETWNAAFADYLVPMVKTPKEIEAYIRASNVEKDKSFGAYYDGVLIGMLFNSIDNYRGKTVAYDAMTGIVPEHRGKGVFSLLFNYTKDALKSCGINDYYLEVITENKKAYEIYKRKGGTVVREFSVLEGRINSDIYCDVKVLPFSSNLINDLSKYEPSFNNRIVAMCRDNKNYQIACAEKDNKKSAVVFNKNGSILQILFEGKNDSDLLYTVLTHLSGNFEKLRISNIPVTETILISELLKMGFNNILNQYEMLIEL